jgi:hypothetical protein
MSNVGSSVLIFLAFAFAGYSQQDVALGFLGFCAYLSAFLDGALHERNRIKKEMSGE